MSDHLNTEPIVDRPEIIQENSKKTLPGWFFISIFIVLIGVVVFAIFNNPKIKGFLSLASDFVKTPVSKVSSYQDRTNILVMGKAGKDHAGGDLTDTMILVSVSLNKPSIVMISLPRDLWIPEIRAKINSSYHYGGMALAKASTETALGVPVHYGIVLDFSGFKDIVDVLGGINVTVENSFTDNLYPITGRENDLCNGDKQSLSTIKTFKCRYEVLHFDAGQQFMNGETALKFVRSRHAEGDEGTDIAREARQQKVITAIENKLMDPKVFLNPKKDLAIWKVVMSTIETDIPTSSAVIIARKVFNARRSVNKYLIPDNLLVNPPTSPKYDKQYVFTPKLGNGRWEDIHKWVTSILN